ncbi:MAG: hypothetical protein LBR54_03380 [Oscillospiraceae bacterium]|jgi:hypothetical protein|nr:hypothetical protein [Oscillospiraceae bacterium]
MKTIELLDYEFESVDEEMTCRFSIPSKWSCISGCYALVVNGFLLYIGGCKNYAKEFNPLTKPFDAIKNNNSACLSVDLYFHPTPYYYQVLYHLWENFKIEGTPYTAKLFRTRRQSLNLKKVSRASKKEVMEYIRSILDTERLLGEKSLILISGEIHKELGLVNLMPTVCGAMYAMMNSSDEVLRMTKSRCSTRIVVEYFL